MQLHSKKCHFFKNFNKNTFFAFFVKLFAYVQNL